jgi:hypothetical protein
MHFSCKKELDHFLLVTIFAPPGLDVYKGQISRLGVLTIDSKNKVDGLTVHTQGITRVASEAAIIFRR